MSSARHWPSRPLAECGTLLTGGTPLRANPSFWNGHIPWITAKSLKKFDVVGSDELLTLDGASKSTIAPTGSALFVVRGMSLAKEFRVGVTGKEVAFNQDLRALVPHVGVDGRYLARFLQACSPTILKLVDEASHGTKRLTSDRFESLAVPLPPLAAQQRIAEILDKADALRTQRRAALAQLDALTLSIFLEMFGDAGSNPKALPKRRLGDLIKLKSGEFLPAAEMAPSGQYPVLGGNGVNGFHDRYMFEERQIVIGRVGVYCGCVHSSPPKSWVTDNALFVRDRNPNLQFDYLLHALTHANLNQHAGRSGQPLVSGSRIYAAEILVPPLELQAEFESRIACATRLDGYNRDALSQLDRLFESLQHRAFAERQCL